MIKKYIPVFVITHQHTGTHSLIDMLTSCENVFNPSFPTEENYKRYPDKSYPLEHEKPVILVDYIHRSKHYDDKFHLGRYLDSDSNLHSFSSVRHPLSVIGTRTKWVIDRYRNEKEFTIDKMIEMFSSLFKRYSASYQQYFERISRLKRLNKVPFDILSTKTVDERVSYLSDMMSNAELILSQHTYSKITTWRKKGSTMSRIEKVPQSKKIFEGITDLIFESDSKEFSALYDFCHQDIFMEMYEGTGINYSKEVFIG